MAAGQTAEFRRWLEVVVFNANPSTTIEAGLAWVRPMLRTAEERELLALAMHELRKRDAADRRRERRRDAARATEPTVRRPRPQDDNARSVAERVARSAVPT